MVELGFAEEYGRVRAAARFTSIQDAINKSRDYSHPIVIYGSSVYELLNSYVYFLSGHYTYREPLVDNTGADLLSYVQQYYNGRLSYFRRVANFMSNSDTYSTSAFNDKGIVTLSALGRKDLFALLAGRFVDTRKKRDGAREEIDEFLKYLEVESGRSGPFIIKLHEDGGNISHKDLVVINMWGKTNRSVPLVILLESKNKPTGFNNSIERQYASLDDGFHLIANQLQCDAEKVRQASDLYRKANNYTPEHLLTRGFTTLNYLDSLREFVPRFTQDESASDLPSPALPRRIVAPIMFDEQDGAISLDRGLTNDPNKLHTIGAARGLKSLSEDILYSGILTNISPQTNRILGRIASIAEKLSLDSDFGDSDIIELGVNCAAIEAHVYKARDRLIEASQGELLAFIAESRRFLRRFESWRTYDADSHDPNRPMVDAYMASLAARILEAAARDNLLNDEANAKVADAVSTTDDKAIAQDEWDVQAAENLLATIGRAALRASKKQVIGSGTKVISEQSDELAEKALHFVNEQATNALELATTHGSHWLEMMINWFRGGI